MSKKHPECPLYKHDNCREIHNPKLCAIVREDKECLKKKKKHGWKYYLNWDRKDKIKEIIKETGKESIIPILLML